MKKLRTILMLMSIIIFVSMWTIMMILIILHSMNPLNDKFISDIVIYFLIITIVGTLSLLTSEYIEYVYIKKEKI